MDDELTVLNERLARIEAMFEAQSSLLGQPSSNEAQFSEFVSSLVEDETVETVDQKGDYIGFAAPPTKQPAPFVLTAESLPSDDADLTRKTRRGKSLSDTQLLDFLILSQNLRRKFFEPEVLSEAAWNMLTDLMMAQLRGERVSVSSACLASGAPETTALRYLNIMRDHGLVRRLPDPADKRRVHIEITSKGAKAMSRYLAKARAILQGNQ